MESLQAKSGGVGPSKPKPTSLVRHIFVRVAFPVGILFLSCFSLLDLLIQQQIRNHIADEARSRDTNALRTSRMADERIRRAVEVLAREAGLQSRDGAPVTPASLESALTRLGGTLDADYLAVTGPNRIAWAALRRDSTRLIPTSLPKVTGNERVLAEIDGQYYFVSAMPITNGVLYSGRHWMREVPIDLGWYVLVNDGKVKQVAGALRPPALQAGASIDVCGSDVDNCERQLGDGNFLLLRSSGSGPAGGPELYFAQSTQVMETPILGITRNIMLVGGFLSVLGALVLALLTGRSILGPLRQITRSCENARGTGQFLEFDIPSTRIAEVNALAQTMKGAIRTIEDGQSKLTQAYFQFMGAIVALLDARDAYTAGHSHRVSAYAEALARDCGLPPDQVDDIRVAALLHDIGKIGVPDEILRKHERLTKEEFDMMKLHPTIGRRVLEQVGQFEKYLDVVELHHENLDGTGYPRGLRGEQIPISARIVKVADVFDALSTDRPYRRGMPFEQVQEILRQGSGTHFDRLLVEIFLTRCVPSFQYRTDLNQLHAAVAEMGVITGIARRS